MIKEEGTQENTYSIHNYIHPFVRAIPPSGIRKFFDLANCNKDIITLGVGEPDFCTPWHVREACVHALEQGYTKYTSNAGLLELREAIAEYLLTSFQVHYEPTTEVLVTIGGSEAIDLALRTLVVAGDEILIPEPCYISYSPIVSLGGGIPIGVETIAENQFKLTAEAITAKLTAKSKVLILCYPNNPTGGVMTYEDWLLIAKLVTEHNLIVISDEMYAELTYDQQHVSFATLPGMKDRTILISGFSKAFAMTGWRIGYACGHPELMAAMMKIHQYTVMCAPVMGQIAALESLRNGLQEKDYMIESYNQRRRLFINGLREIGLHCHEPKGAFYAFPCIKTTGLTSEQFATELLLQAQVATVPGHVFGPDGEGYIRCSYATSATKLAEALERMEKYLDKIQR